jgi:O-antigen/teichoic acid export membrane protein
MSDTMAASWRRKALLTRATTLIKQPLFANAGYLLGVNLVGGLTGFAFWGLVARLYQPTDVGIASAVLSAVALLSGLSSLGIGTGLVRFLPEARFPRRLLNTAFTFNVVVACLVAGLFLAGLELWAPSLIALRQDVLNVSGFLAYAAAATLGATIQMVFVARRQARYTFVHTSIVNGGRLPLAIALAGLGAAGLVGSVALAVTLAVVLSLMVFVRRVEPEYQPRPDLLWRDLATLIPYSAGSYVATLLAQTSQMILPLMTLEMLGARFSGYAYIAWMLGSLLTSPGAALASSAFAEGSHAPESLSPVLWKAVTLGLALTVPAALGLGIVAPWFLTLFGADYAREASGLLRWLAAAAPVAVLSSLYFTYLRVRKQVRHLILASGIVAAITLGTAGALMPRYGIAASGVGWLVGNSLVAIIAVWQMARDGATVG